MRLIMQLKLVPQFLFIDGTRVGDVRVYEDGVMPTVIQRWGTGGGNVPAIFPIDDAREVEKNQNGLGIGEDGAPAYTLDTRQAPAVAQVTGPLTSTGMSRARGTETTDSHHFAMSESMVRRLTPTECERLQGFPDGWTSQRYDFKKNVVIDQADSSRYKQMGNAVAVPVVDWIISRLITEVEND
jgi:DNA (cytosine-5)-methyltransferase 1